MTVVLLLSGELVAHKSQTLHDWLFPFGAQLPLDPFSCFVGEFPWSSFDHFIGMFVCRIPQETELLSVPATPCAQEHMQAKSDSLENRQLAVERRGLQPRSLPAIGGKHGHPSGEGFQHSV